MHFAVCADGPIVTHTHDQGGHLRVGPYKRVIVAIEDGPDPTRRVVPASSPVIVVQQGVKRQSQVAVGSPSDLRQLADSSIGVEHFAKDLDARPVAKKLTRRE